MSKPQATPEGVPLPLDAGMLDGLPDPVFLVDPDHVVVDCNRAARLLLGADALGAALNAGGERARHPHRARRRLRARRPDRRLTAARDRR